MLPEPSGDGASIAEIEGLRLYREQVRRLRALTSEEQRELLDRVRQGDRRAGEELTWAFLRHVVDIVDQWGARGSEVPALLEVGNLALVRAIATFGSTDHTDFEGYARSRIRRAIERAA
jgi:RNA polymerase primary sigma factor